MEFLNRFDFLSSILSLSQLVLRAFNIRRHFVNALSSVVPVFAGSSCVNGKTGR